jgi:hypothetical protein
MRCLRKGLKLAEDLSREDDPSRAHGRPATLRASAVQVLQV